MTKGEDFDVTIALASCLQSHPRTGLLVGFLYAWVMVTPALRAQDAIKYPPKTRNHFLVKNVYSRPSTSIRN